MNLKKTDKIILGVGVLLLIIIAATVIVYNADFTDETDDEDDMEPEEYIYEVMCEEKEVETTCDTFSIKDPLLGKGTLEETDLLTINQENLKSVELTVEFTDNKMLLGLLGKDQLTVTIIDPDGTEHECEMITGNGTETVTISGINSKINTKEITAEDIYDAEVQLEDMYENDWDGETFTIKATLKAKGLLDNKNDFTVKAKYTYYDYDLEDITPEPDDDEDEDKDTVLELGMFSNYYKRSSLGRDW